MTKDRIAFPTKSDLFVRATTGDLESRANYFHMSITDLPIDRWEWDVKERLWYCPLLADIHIGVLDTTYPEFGTLWHGWARLLCGIVWTDTPDELRTYWIKVLAESSKKIKALDREMLSQETEESIAATKKFMDDIIHKIDLKNAADRANGVEEEETEEEKAEFEEWVASVKHASFAQLIEDMEEQTKLSTQRIAKYKEEQKEK